MPRSGTKRSSAPSWSSTEPTDRRWCIPGAMARCSTTPRSTAPTGLVSSNSSGSQSPRCKRHSTRSSTHTWPSPPPRTSPTLYDGCFLYDFGACRMWLIDLDEYRPGPARSCRRRLGAGLNPQRQHARQQRSTVCTHVGRIHPGRSLLEHLVVSAPGHPTRRRRLAGPAPGTGRPTVFRTACGHIFT